MQIKVCTIDVRFPRWLKRVLVFGAIPAAVLLGTVQYLRADVTVPTTFADGDTLSAAKLNENFNALETGVNSLAATVTALQGTVSTSAVPPGTVVAFAGETPPNGWLLCDGAAVSRAAYAVLFGAIGIAHGGGNGTDTFNVPDYRGRFLRGVDGSASRDPDAANRLAPQEGVGTVTGGVGNAGNSVGSVEGSATSLPTTPFATDSQGLHTHSIEGGAYLSTGSPITWFAGAYAYEIRGINEQPAGTHTHTISGGGDSETRPVNAYVNYIIKY